MKAYSFYFNASDWLASQAVKQMSLAERGAYIGLLAFAWGSEQPGTLPASEDKVRRLAEMSPAEWAVSSEILLEKFPLSECGTYRYNPRLRAEAAKEQSRSDKAKESANKRWQCERNANASNTNANASEKPCERNAQVKESKVKNKERSVEGAQAVGQVLASPSESKKANQEKSGAPTGPQLWPDEAQVFLTANFSAYLDKIGYGHVDKRIYLAQCQTRAEELNEQRTEEGWQNFVKAYFNVERANNRLMLPMPFEQPEKPAIQPMPANPRAALWGYNDAPPSTVAEPRPTLQPKPAGQFAGPIIR